MPKKVGGEVRSLSVRRIETAPSRNRDDILDDIKGEEIIPNDVELRGHHVVWHTDPEELLRVAQTFKAKYRKAGEGLYVGSTGCMLTVYRPGRTFMDEWEPGVSIRNAGYAYVTPEVEIFVYPSVLIRAAKRLANAPWEKKKASLVYGSDRRVIQLRIGNDIITVYWTPELDQQGVPQISSMIWAAWNRKQNREFQEEMRDLDRQRRSQYPRCTCHKGGFCFYHTPIRSAV